MHCSLGPTPGAEASPAFSLPGLEGLALPCTRFTLDNGLTVIVHEDRKAPLVAVNVTYLVGAKDEPPGRTGFAHLFEHLMFGGSGNLPGSYIVNLSDAGASNLNGTTSHDRTNYYETVPTSALDYALFAESDRMGHFLQAITQETLDQQRGVVTNEKRQREGAPYGGVTECLLRAMYPPTHPYAHTVLGSMQDLVGASLDDVRDWFGTWYSPCNAILTLAGDIDVDTAREKAQQYFGDIAPGRLPPSQTAHAWVPTLAEPRHETLYDQVPLSRLLLTWHAPVYNSDDAIALRIAGLLLAGRRTARLDKRLLHGDQRLASNVSCGLDAGQVAGRFTIAIDALDGGADFARIETEVTAALDQLRLEGPSVEELRRIQFQEGASFLRGTTGVSAVASLLSDHQRLTGEPDSWRRRMQVVGEATPERIQAAMERWLTRPALHLKVLPAPVLKASGVGIDRSRVPLPAAATPGHLPALERATLSNGLQVILARRHDRPLLKMALHLPVGQSDDPLGREGLSRLTTSLLTSGAGERSGDDFAQAMQDNAATISSRGGLDWTVVELSALSARLAPSLELFADAIARPRLEAKDVERARGEQVRAIGREFSQPGALAMRALPTLLYGHGHRYARSPSGLGVRASAEAMCRDDAVAFHARWFRPSRATLVVAGDVTLDDLLPQLERYLASWRGAGPLQPDPVRVTIPPAGRACYLDHRANAQQSHLTAACLVPESDPDWEAATELANEILGGGFSSRINMNLREDKHWTYGARSMLVGSNRGQRIFQVGAPVQADQTAASMKVILDELRGMLGNRPITAAELRPRQQAAAARLAGNGETLGGICAAIELLVQHSLPDDHWQQRAARLLAVNPEAANAALARLIDPDRLVWLISGDRQMVEPQLQAAGWMDIDSLELEQ